MALAHIDRGEHEQAHALVGVPDEGQDAHFTYNWSLFARGRLALAQGDPSARSTTCSSAGAGSSGFPRRTRACSAVALGGGARGASRSVASSRRAGWRTRSWSWRAPSARRARSASRCARSGSSRRTASGSRCWRRRSRRSSGRRRSSSSGARSSTSARAQHAAGQRTVARETLRTGLDIAHHAGADGLAGAARAALVAAGARPRRPAVRGADALTPSERRVAELAERGLTNREIAQALFVSTKTVEFHLRNAYFKLRISSRGRAERRHWTGRRARRQARP